MDDPIRIFTGYWEKPGGKLRASLEFPSNSVRLSQDSGNLTHPAPRSSSESPHPLLLAWPRSEQSLPAANHHAAGATARSPTSRRYPSIQVAPRLPSTTVQL